MATLIPQIETGAIPTSLLGLGVDSTRIGLDGTPVPVLRGRLHQVSVLPASIAGTALVLLSPGILLRIAAAIFAASILAMLSASAFYHCHAHTWTVKLRARQVDHSMIFVAIAGSESAFWLAGAPQAAAIPASVLIWVIAAAGIRHKLAHLTLTGTTGSWLYGALGWASVMLMPFLMAAGDWAVIGLVVVGGLTYSMGSRLLVAQAPNPVPGVFGYHEVWHVLVVGGVIMHGLALATLTGIIG